MSMDKLDSNTFDEEKGLNVLVLQSLDADCNHCINMVIHSALMYGSPECNLVHYAMMVYSLCNMDKHSELRKKLKLNKEDIDLGNLLKVYTEFVADDMLQSDCTLGENGLLKTKYLTPELLNNVDIVEYLSEEVYEFIHSLESSHSAENRATFNEFLNNILPCLQADVVSSRFLNALGVNINDVEIIPTHKALKIPKELASFLTDLRSDDKITSSRIYGVDVYANKAIEVLSRKVKANPCLIGKAGVGKTSIVHRIVQKVNKGEAPEKFKDTEFVELNVSAMLAGTKYRGDFEARMDSVIKWLSNKNIVLFVDELHSFINAGGVEDNGVAANYLKPALSNGSVKLISATTLSEYHKYIEDDAALTRRIQAIEVKEPSREVAKDIITNVIQDYEEYHDILVSDEMIVKAISLTDRYMKNKALPDKALTVLDQACARVKLAGGESVDEETLLDIISEDAGVDIRKASTEQTSRLLKLEDIIEKQIVGQSKAVKKVCKAIRRSKAGTSDENKPIATFLFVGPTGVGKTELSKVLSKEVVASKEAFIKIDMSEYADKGSITRLVGASPSYVGYGEGGQLTEQVKHNPYSLILFDEIEKACDEAYNILLQLLDEGRLTDGQGETVDFTNCIIVMTSNVGCGEQLKKTKTLGFNTSEPVEDEEVADDKIRESLEKHFKPEFLNRFDDIINFNHLGKEQCKDIVNILLDKLANRLEENRDIGLTFSDSVVNVICEEGFSEKYGARNLRRKIQDIVEDDLSCYILDGTIKVGSKYIIDYDKDKKKLEVI